MLGLLIGVAIGLHGLGMHFDPDAVLETTHVVMSHECSTDCGVDD